MLNLNQRLSLKLRLSGKPNAYVVMPMGNGTNHNHYDIDNHKIKS